MRKLKTNNNLMGKIKGFLVIVSKTNEVEQASFNANLVLGTYLLCEKYIGQ